MGTAKTMSDEQLADLGKDLSRMHELALSVWERAMKMLPVQSPEYRAICAAGRKTQVAYHRMREEAVRRGWSPAERKRVFSSDVTCGFS